MIYINLFLEFFKIGLFSVGGGYATMPFLYHIIQDYGWYSAQDLSNMIAVSIITPGPVGVNMATFAGFKTAGIVGALVATFSLMFPSYLFVVFISKLLKSFYESFWVKAILYSLKPAGCGLLTAVGLNFFKEHITNIYSMSLLLFLFLLSFKFKKNPIYYFIIAAVIAILLDYFNLIKF